MKTPMANTIINGRTIKKNRKPSISLLRIQPTPISDFLAGKFFVATEAWEAGFAIEYKQQMDC
jgi:hypothetical protein